MVDETIEVDGSPSLPAAGQVAQITPDQLAVIAETHFRALAFGIVGCNPFVPQNLMWEAMAAGFGRVLSGATQGADIKAALEARDKLAKLVTDSVRKAYPAVNSASLAAVTQTPANGNGKLILPH